MLIQLDLSFIVPCTKLVTMRTALFICILTMALPSSAKKKAYYPSRNNHLHYPTWHTMTMKASHSTLKKKYRLVDDLGDAHFMILRNHRLLLVLIRLQTHFCICISCKEPARFRSKRKIGGGVLTPIPAQYWPVSKRHQSK